MLRALLVAAFAAGLLAPDGVAAVETILVYQPFNANPSAPFLTAAKEFNETYAGKWGVDFVYGSFADLQVWAVSGDPNRGGRMPDVITVGGVVDNLVQAKAVIPLTSYLDDWANFRPDGDITKDIARASTFMYFINNDWWALPISLDLRPFMYRVDLYKKYLNTTTPPQTWEEMVVNSLAIQAMAKANDNATYWGFLAPNNKNDRNAIQVFAPFFISFGASVATSKIECAMNSLQFRSAVKFWTDLATNETRRISPNLTSSTFGDYISRMANGEIIHWFDGPWDKVFSSPSVKTYPCNTDLSRVNFTSDKIHVAMMKPLRGPRLRASYSGGSALAIASGSDNKDAAMAFLRIFTDPAKAHMQSWINNGNGPPFISLQALQDSTVPLVSGMMCQSAYAYPEAYPKSFGEYVKIRDQMVIPKILNQVVSGNLTVDAATDEACAIMDAMVFPPPESVSFSSTVGGVITAVNASLQILCIAVIAMLYWLRAQPSIVAMDLQMSCTVLVGCVVFLADTYTYMGAASVVGCRSSVFLLTIGSGLTLGPCLAKLYRIWNVFESVGAKKLNLRTSALFAIVAAITVPEVVLGIIWTIVDPPSFVKLVTDSGVRMQICRSKSEILNTGFFWAILAYNVALLLAGLTLAWLSRNAYDRFNESREIGIGFMNILFLGLVWVLMSVASLSTDFQFWIRAAFMMSMVLALITTLYAPRIMKAYQSKASPNGGDEFDFQRSSPGTTISTAVGGGTFKKTAGGAKPTDVHRADCAILRSTMGGMLKRWSKRKISYMPGMQLLVLEPDSKRGYPGEVYRVLDGSQLSKLSKSEGVNEDVSNATYCLKLAPIEPQKHVTLLIQFADSAQVLEWETAFNAKVVGSSTAGGSGSQEGSHNGAQRPVSVIASRRRD
ncbi:hypothetical protein HDU93_008016 [Gonapodya sp. JEL0774]|nr:hypothetical protein HDU93_008016 [Gonapodya sp. JEL0774]